VTFEDIHDRVVSLYGSRCTQLSGGDRYDKYGIKRYFVFYVGHTVASRYWCDETKTGALIRKYYMDDTAIVFSGTIDETLSYIECMRVLEQ
jgi:hypothetical protein